MESSFFCLLLFVFRVSCSPCWLLSYCVTEVNLELLITPASTFQVLQLLARAPIPASSRHSWLHLEYPVLCLKLLSPCKIHPEEKVISLNMFENCSCIISANSRWAICNDKLYWVWRKEIEMGVSGILMFVSNARSAYFSAVYQVDSKLNKFYISLGKRESL